ncbi:MAG: FkbM family methyltransferase [Candidatus Micrarchaeaceae archaeon]
MIINFDPNKNVDFNDYLLSFLLDNSIIKNINGYIIKRKIVKNWYQIPLFKLNIKREINLELRSGFVKNFQTYNEYLDFWRTKLAEKEFFKNVAKMKINIKSQTIEILWHGKWVKIFYNSIKQFENAIFLIKEQFIEEQYKCLNIKNKIVIDIGANVGDTAIYFALMGAKHVYSFEPYPYSYRLGVKNIKLNNLDNKITFFNIGLGKNSKKINIYKNYENTFATELKNFKNGIPIKIKSLEEILKYIKNKDAIMKIDCEGSEYNLILNTNKKSLRKFQEIIIEYHYGYKNLVKKIKNAGFRIKIKRPIFSINSEMEIKNIKRGIIYCKRIEINK